VGQQLVLRDRRAAGTAPTPAPVHESLTAGLVLLVLGVAAVLVIVWGLQAEGAGGTVNSGSATHQVATRTGSHHVLLEVVQLPTGPSSVSSSTAVGGPLAVPPFVRWTSGPHSHEVVNQKPTWKLELAAPSGRTVSISAGGGGRGVECLIVVDNRPVAMRIGQTVDCSGVVP
jgi:hypothetical protein